MANLKIDKEFQNLIPPLTADEYKQLEENIIKEGCRDSLVTWSGTIVDGHNRYKICNENKIPYSTRDMDFDSRDEVIEWIIKNQFGRRNLPAYERAKLALRLKPIIKARAREQQGVRNDIPQKSVESCNPIDTQKELAKAAGVSHDTIYKVEVIESNGSEDVKAKVRSGEYSINKAWEIAKKPSKVQTRKCSICGKEFPASEFHVGCYECKTCKNARHATGLNSKDARELNEMFPDSEMEKFYEDMKKPLLPTEASGNRKDVRNSIITEFEELLNGFNGMIKKFQFMPQVKECTEVKELAAETISILKIIIE